MKKGLLTSVGLSVLLMLGCSGALNQDPLKDRPGPLREGVPPEQKPGHPEAKPEKSMVIDHPEKYTFIEERADEMLLGLRLLVPDYVGQLEIANLDLFPGAVFDPETGIFSWTPAKGTVTNAREREMVLRIVGLGEPSKPGDRILAEEAVVTIKVIKKLTQPIIKAIIPANAPWREGDSFKVNVLVVDPDAGDDPSDYPKLQFLPIDTKKDGDVRSLLPFTVIESVSVDRVKKEWNFRLNVNLRDDEFTASSAFGGFRIRVLNRFQEISSEELMKIKVFTKLSTLSTSWQGTVEINGGQESRIPFLIYDSKGEAIIRAEIDDIEFPADAKFQCNEVRRGLLSCEIRWEPPVIRESALIPLLIRVQGRNADSSDSQNVDREIRVQLKVKGFGP